MSNGNVALSAWNRLKRRPGGKWLFSAYVAWKRLTFVVFDRDSSSYVPGIVRFE